MIDAPNSQATSASKKSFLLGGRELLPKRLDLRLPDGPSNPSVAKCFGDLRDARTLVARFDKRFDGNNDF
jgi:hypothetical protein